MSDVIMFEELIKSSPFAVIELFELHLDPVIHGSNTIFRFYSGVVVQTSTAEIIYQGNTYVAIPIEAQGFEYTAGQSGFPRPTLRVGNLFSVVSALMLNVNETTFGNDLTGAKVVRIKTLSRFLDAVNFTGGTNPYGTPSGEQMPQEVYFVNRKIVENRDVVEFELAAKLDLETSRLQSGNVLPTFASGFTAAPSVATQAQIILMKTIILLEPLPRLTSPIQAAMKNLLTVNL